VPTAYCRRADFPERLKRNLSEIATNWTGWRATLGRGGWPVAKLGASITLAAIALFAAIETTLLHVPLSIDAPCSSDRGLPARINCFRFISRCGARWPPRIAS